MVNINLTVERIIEASDLLLNKSVPISQSIFDSLLKCITVGRKG